MHDEETGTALVVAAERIVEQEGLEALSVRRVADEVGTTTRAVYTVFGSKDGLVVVLGTRAFDILGAAVEALPVTADPNEDLVHAGADAFRAFALSHPALFRIAIQRHAVTPEAGRGFHDAAATALGSLNRRLARLEAVGGLGGRGIADAAWQFHALCEGLAGLELRSTLEPARAHVMWADALRCLVAGWRSAVPPQRPSPVQRNP